MLCLQHESSNVNTHTHNQHNQHTIVSSPVMAQQLAHDVADCDHIATSSQYTMSNKLITLIYFDSMASETECVAAMFT